MATSNYPPQGLLPDPRHHALVLPLIATIEEHCDIRPVVLAAGPPAQVLDADLTDSARMRSRLQPLQSA